MSTSPDDKPNPYESPAMVAASANAPLELERPLATTLGVFHSQMLILGWFWVFAGLIAVLVAAGSSDVLDVHITGRLQYTWASIFYGVTGLIWIASGVSTCWKQIWAVYVGLVLTCVHFAATVLHGYLCFPSVFLIAAILQSYRVLGWAKELSAAGIPITTRPKQPQFPLPD
jgi:hypothetical protein